MTTDDAFEMVLELARENVLEEQYAGTKELKRCRNNQIAACDMVEDFYVNHIAD